MHLAAVSVAVVSALLPELCHTGKGRESFSAYALAKDVCRSAEKDSRPSSVVFSSVVL